MRVEFLKKLYPIQVGANNPILRSKSEPIKKIDDEIKHFGEILETLMFEYDGVWLAAPQIGKNIRMIAVTFWDERFKDYKFLWSEVMINPKIVYFSKETNIDEEACLSLPGIYWDVERANEIIVEYLDLKWRKKTKKLKGLSARIVQHEVDHLDGILFIDKVIKNENLKVKSNWKIKI